MPVLFNGVASKFIRTSFSKWRLLDFPIDALSRQLQAPFILDSFENLFHALPAISPIWGAAGVDWDYRTRGEDSDYSSQRRAWALLAGRDFFAGRSARGNFAARNSGRNGNDGYGAGVEAPVFQRRRCAVQHFSVRRTGRWGATRIVGRRGAVDYTCRIGAADFAEPAAGAGVAEEDGEVTGFAGRKFQGFKVSRFQRQPILT
jgi:hypothetical protein